MKIQRLFAALAAAAMVLPVAQAQNEQIAREHRFGRAVPAEGLINRDAVTQAGKNVGQIEEIMFDLESGRILYVGLNRKGLGKGDMVAVPPTLFSLRQRQADRGEDEGGLRARLTGRPVMIRVNEQALEGAPAFPKDPEQAVQGAYVDKVYAHFNQPRWWEGASGDSKAGQFNHVRRASNVQKLTVQNSSNEKLGQVETVLFDLPGGRVSYVVLDPKGSVIDKEVLLPIPPMALTKNPEGGRVLILGVDKEKLNNAPSINRDELTAESIEKLSRPDFAARVYNYYGKQPWFRDANIPSPTSRDRGENDRDKDDKKDKDD